MQYLNITFNDSVSLPGKSFCLIEYNNTVKNVKFEKSLIVDKNGNVEMDVSRSEEAGDAVDKTAHPFLRNILRSIAQKIAADRSTVEKESNTGTTDAGTRKRTDTKMKNVKKVAIVRPVKRKTATDTEASNTATVRRRVETATSDSSFDSSSDSSSESERDANTIDLVEDSDNDEREVRPSTSEESEQRLRVLTYNANMNTRPRYNLAVIPPRGSIELGNVFHDDELIIEEERPEQHRNFLGRIDMRP